MKILVTGASGFVGRHLTDHLRAHGDQVVAAFFPAGLEPDETIEHRELLDIREAQAVERLLAAYDIDAVIHLAAQAFVPEGEINPAETMAINIGGTANLLRALTLHRPRARLLLVSSAEVYGSAPPEKMPFTEVSQPQPANFYAQSKLLTEQLALYQARLHGLDVIVARPFTHIGPGQSPRFSISGFARQLAEIKAGRQQPVLRVGNLSARRDITDVRDVVSAYRLALRSVSSGSIFNICTGKAFIIEELVRKLIGIAAMEIDIEIDPTRLRPIDLPVLYGSADKLLRETGWRPQRPIEETLRDIYRYWVVKS
ncbi:MAG TPA: GDP-mannose 4,6-dehydratase [bacterium]|nr:GDP-mannose 4,6-dehydratase [bacterium]